MDAYAPSDFRPLQFPFFSNAHVQTIIGSEALRTKVFGAYPRSFSTRRERIETKDGDFFHVDWTIHDSPSSRNGIVVILHGLESNTDGALVTKMATAFIESDFHCCLVSFRGCSGEENLTPGAYHLGFTDDLNQITSHIQSIFPSYDIYLSGFSLGGNVCLKFLGELGFDADTRNIRGAVVCSVPFDPVASQHKLDDQGFNRIVYSGNFLATLRQKALRKHAKFPGLFNIDEILKADTIGQFDDNFIAKIYGFANKTDYYRKTGSKWFLSRIRVPVVAINARDDPFIEEMSLPSELDLKVESAGDTLAPVKLVYTKNGGHCGFMTGEEEQE